MASDRSVSLSATIVVGLLLVIAALLSVMVYLSLRSSALPRLHTEYHAVLLSNGQAFYGKVDSLSTSYLVLSDVHYVQRREDPQKKESVLALVPRGKEWHSPDRMLISSQHILVVEPVGSDSQVAKSIAALKSSK